MVLGFPLGRPATSLSTRTMSPSPKLSHPDSAPEDPMANFCNGPPGRGPESPRLLPPLTQALASWSSATTRPQPRPRPGPRPRPASLPVCRARAVRTRGWGSSPLRTPRAPIPPPIPSPAPSHTHTQKTWILTQGLPSIPQILGAPGPSSCRHRNGCRAGLR